MPKLYISIVIASLFCVTAARSENILFPPAADLIDIAADLGAVGDGKTDNTEAFRKIIEGDAFLYYLPDGEYLISDTIDFKGKIFKIIQGQSREGTVIRLADSAPGFEKAGEKGKPMIKTGQPPAIRFRNSLRNLTLDVGKGNPGATGIEFYVNNQGCLRDITIRSGADGSEPGFAGLSMSLGEVGPLLVRNLEVIGFDIGIDVKNQVNSVTLENITLRKQRVVGIQNWQNMVFVRKLDSLNSVPAVKNGGDDSAFLLVDSKITGEGKASERAATTNTHAGGTFHLGNVEVSGYAKAFRDETDGTVLELGTIAEFSTDAPAMLHPSRAGMLDLPVAELPEIPMEKDFSKWANVMDFGADPTDREDDAPAIQKAIDSGATTVYFPQRIRTDKGKRYTYFIGTEIVIRGNVERIIGCEQIFEVAPPLLVPHEEDGSHEIAEDKPVFRFADGKAPVAILERFAKTLGQDFLNPFVIHESKRDLVLSSISGLSNVIHKGPGKLFADDVVGPAWKIRKGAELYAWQLNLEGDEDYKIDNDGGLVWVLGLKTEHRGPTLLTRNGGRTEILGCHLYTCVSSSVDKGQIFVEDASFSMAAAGEYAWTRSWATENLINETRDGKTLTYKTGAFAKRASGSALPLISLVSGVKPEGTAPAAPKAETVGEDAVSITLKLSSEDAEGDLAGFEISRDGEMPSFLQPPPRKKHNAVQLTLHEGNVRGIVKPGTGFKEANLQPETEYTYRVVAFDRFNQRSAETVIKVKTGSDKEAPTAPEALVAYRNIDILTHLKWQGAKDNLGVTGYRLRRLEEEKESWVKDLPPSINYIDRDVVKGTSYAYELSAMDKAGNFSETVKLAVTTPVDPPTDQIIEMENYQKFAGNMRKSNSSDG